MTKEEIIQSIEESIVPNNKKAISAQSLKNVLIGLAENSGGSDEGLYFFGMLDYLNRDMIPTGDELNDEWFTTVMDWNAMTYAKLAEIINILENEAEIAEIPPINVTIIGGGLEDVMFIPAVVTMSFDGGEMVFIITPCNEYKDGFLARIIIESDMPQKIGYTLCSDGSYNRFNPLCIFLPEENITLSEWVNEYNREVCTALMLQAVEPSKISVIPITSYNDSLLKEWEELNRLSQPLSYIVDAIYATGVTIGRCTTVDFKKGILFTDNSGIHRINVNYNFNPTTVTNLIEFPEV
jgi:hypothetical protein